MKPAMFTIQTEIPGEEPCYLTLMRHRSTPEASQHVVVYNTEFRHGRFQTDLKVDLGPVPDLDADGQFRTENGIPVPVRIVSKEENEELHLEGVVRLAKMIYGHKRGRCNATNSMIHDLSDEVQKLFW